MLECPNISFRQYSESTKIPLVIVLSRMRIMNVKSENCTPAYSLFSPPVCYLTVFLLLGQQMALASCQPLSTISFSDHFGTDSNSEIAVTTIRATILLAGIRLLSPVCDLVNFLIATCHEFAFYLFSNGLPVFLHFYEC